MFIYDIFLNHPKCNVYTSVYTYIVYTYMCFDTLEIILYIIRIIMWIQDVYSVKIGLHKSPRFAICGALLIIIHIGIYKNDINKLKLIITFVFFRTTQSLGCILCTHIYLTKLFSYRYICIYIYILRAS